MRAPVPACLTTAALLAALCGCIDHDPARVTSFTRGPAGSFVYSAHTNTVMSANADGAAEAIRRDWLAQALDAHGLCRAGYAVYRRTLVVPRQRPAFGGTADELAFGNSGDVVYDGGCL
jgi:hypothetical protein